MADCDAYCLDLNKKKSYTFFILVTVYFIIHYIQFHGFGPEVVRFYAKDIILVPFLMLGINATTTTLGKQIRIGLKELILTVLICTLAFELIFPRFGMAFAFDLSDIICYVIGASLYYFLFLHKSKTDENQYILKPDNL